MGCIGCRVGSWGAVLAEGPLCLVLADGLVLGSRGHMGGTDVPGEVVWDGGIGSPECRQGKTSHMATLLMIMVTKATGCEGSSARRKRKG